MTELGLFVSVSNLIRLITANYKAAKFTSAE